MGGSTGASSSPTDDTGGLAFELLRPHGRVALLDVRSTGHREFFQITEGERTLVVTVLDVTNPAYPEPRSYVVEKPFGWCTDSSAQDLLLAIWKAVTPG